jgi:D-alanyl-D-alanine carboxypeptidase (penicillin-binding protein 5/6)
VYLSTSRLLAALCVVVLALPVAGAGPRRTGPTVSCTACFLIDDSGRVLFARAAGAALPNASTTKMTTALLVTRRADLDEVIEVSARAAGTGGGGLDLAPGERWPLRSLLVALLLTSSNDAAVALAEHVSGTEGAFVAAMERFVTELGATHTDFVTAHGLDFPGHGSSARDLALIATELLADPVLADIVDTPRARVAGPAGAVLLENRNLLLESYRGATGVKTGFTAEAGNVLVASAERSDRRLIAVAMDSDDAAQDARALLDYGWERLARTILVARGAPVGAFIFEGGATSVVAATPVRGSARPVAVTVEFRPAADIELPMTAGDVVGDVVVITDSGVLETVDAVAVGAVATPGHQWAADVVAGVLRALGGLVSDR